MPTIQYSFLFNAGFRQSVLQCIVYYYFCQCDDIYTHPKLDYSMSFVCYNTLKTSMSKMLKQSFPKTDVLICHG